MQHEVIKSMECSFLFFDKTECITIVAIQALDLLHNLVQTTITSSISISKKTSRTYLHSPFTKAQVEAVENRFYKDLLT